MFTPYRYSVHNILLFPSVLMKSWLIPKVLKDGVYSFFIPRSWAVVGLNNLHRNVPCYLFRFPARIFMRIFQKRFRFPNGTLESLKVYASLLWSQYLTIFFLSLKLICGVDGQEDICIPWLHVLLSRMVIQAGIGTQPNSGLMEHGVFGGYGVDGVDGFPFELNFIICNLRWRVGFSFSFLSLFF